MEPDIKAALDAGGIADITTTGRKSGLPRRIEIYFHQFDGAYYLTGRPGRKRDWESNIEANPEFTLHLKRGVSADLDVVAEQGVSQVEKRRILLRALVENWDSDPERAEQSVDHWVENSPFVKFSVSG